MSVTARTLLIDMDGVLYQGERAIPGTQETLDWLNSKQIPHLFLTNTTSRPRSALVEKLARMGVHVEIEQILTPPVAATRWLSEHVNGPVALFVARATLAEFETLEIASLDTTNPVSSVVIGDYGEHWTYHALNQAFRWLMSDNHPALIALGMTRYWQAEDGLRLDTAPFVSALEHATGQQALVLGKPAAPFFESALGEIGATAAETLMIGDDIHSDIGGAQVLSIRGILVKTGKFRPEDLTNKTQTAAVLDSFAELPDIWQDNPE
ncbi:MAG: TIGR01458 family HAD-type hydrolase [Candidatus Thiodiazotropha endolucinida]|nr:TIGR01458 family HAD-type hydrolase [Candidatus Thiodiazotropha endolucinida]